jgi:hypothetical protein
MPWPKSLKQSQGWVSVFYDSQPSLLVLSICIDFITFALPFLLCLFAHSEKGSLRGSQQFDREHLKSPTLIGISNANRFGLLTGHHKLDALLDVKEQQI